MCVYFRLFFLSDSKTMPAKVSFNIDLGPDLSNEVMDIARKQGEDPERVSSDIQELRDMIFGKSLRRKKKVSIEMSSFIFEAQIKVLSHCELTKNNSNQLFM